MIKFDELKEKLVTIFDDLIKEKMDLEEYKTDGGEKYPKEAYLYVPDPDKPSTWKLRIWETPESKVTRRQLGRAAAAFSAGGFRGQKVDLPSDEIKSVKAKLVALYKKDGAEKDEIPAYLLEEEGGGDSMIKLEELEAKLAEEKKVLEEKYTKMFSEMEEKTKKVIDETSKKLDETSKRLVDAEKKLSEREVELHGEKVVKMTNDLLTNGVWPAVVEKVKKVMLKDKGNVTIKLDENSTEMTFSEILVDILNTIPKESRISFNEITNSSGKDEKKYMSEDEVVKYANEHKITFEDACSVLAKEGKLEYLRLS